MLLTNKSKRERMSRKCKRKRFDHPGWNAAKNSVIRHGPAPCSSCLFACFLCPWAQYCLPAGLILLHCREQVIEDLSSSWYVLASSFFFFLFCSVCFNFICCSGIESGHWFHLVDPLGQCSGLCHSTCLCYISQVPASQGCSSRLRWGLNSSGLYFFRVPPCPR